MRARPLPCHGTLPAILASALSLLLGHTIAYSGIDTQFSEDSLPPEIQLDIPSSDAAEIVLDTENDELDFNTTGNTDMWTERNNAPFAWAANPGLPAGSVWSVETFVRYNGAEDANQRVAGILFYADDDGVGGSNGGIDFTFGLNDWNNRGVEAQGLGGTQVGDSGQNFINAADAIGNPPAAFLRVDIEEGGDTDQYTLFYKLEEADEWTQLAQFNSDQDNSRVGLFFKNGGGTAEEDRSVSFTHFRLDDGTGGGGGSALDVVTQFTEDSLIEGIQLDIPDDGLAEIVLDAENDELDINTLGNTDMWTERNNAPFVWAANPNLPQGAVWSVETFVRYNGLEDADQRVAGLVFYADEDGIGGSNGGIDFSYGLNDWNNRGIEAQGLGGTQVGDSGQNFINAADDVGNPSAAFLRADIKEGGDTDEYTLFYKLEEADPWTELAMFNSDQDNSRVAMFIKTGNNTAPDDASVSFTYFSLTVLSGVDDADGDDISNDYETANGLDPNDPSDRDLDSDGDGLTNFEEFTLGLPANNADADEDGLLDGVETDTGTWTSAEDTGTDPWNADTDGDGLLDGAESNTGEFVSEEDTGSNPLLVDTDGDNARDAAEVALGTDPSDPASVPANTIGQGAWPLQLDIPNEDLATIRLDPVNNELVIETHGNTDMWTERRDAPIAWAPNPNLPVGELWAVETEVVYNGAEDGTQRVAGIVFYPDEDGVGGSNAGVDFSFGLNDWNNRGVEVQGLGGTEVGDSAMPFISAQDDVGNPSRAFLRAEIVEGGDTDEYTLFYKLEAEDEWVELAMFNSDQDNSRVGLMIKTGGNTAAEDRSVSFTYFLLDDGTLDTGPQIIDIRVDDMVSIDFTTPSPTSDHLLEMSTTLLANDWSVVQDATLTSENDLFNLTAVRPEAPAAYFRVAMLPPPPLFFEDFESGAEGWVATTNQGTSEWELGTPAVEGLMEAWSGEQVYGTDLDGLLEAGTQATLRSPVIDLTGVARPRLSFFYYVDTTEAAEGVRINIYNETGDTALYETPVDEILWGKTDTWTQFGLTIPEAARDQPIIVEWELLVDDGGEAGFYLDDVEVD